MTTTMMRTALAAAALGLSPAVSALDFYAGADYLLMETSVTRSFEPAGSRDDAPVPIRRDVRTDAEGSAIMAHVGLWLNESFSLEVRGSFSGEDAEVGATEDDNTAEIEEFYGVYILPRAEPFSWLDMMFPMGMSHVKVVQPVRQTEDGQATLQANEADTISYGIDLRFRLGKLIADEDSFLGSFTLNTGFMVYADDDDVEARGYNGGLQLGFSF